MNSVTKLALIEPRVLENLQSSSPNAAAMTEIDKDMLKIIQSSNLSTSEKVNLYNQRLQRYLTFQEKQNTPMQIQVKSPKAESSTIESSLIGRFPKTLKGKAQALLDIIRNSNAMSWNANGELIYQNAIIHGSHIEDLVNDVLKNKNKNTTGWQVFARGLKSLNVPNTLVLNKARWNYMHPPPQTSPRVTLRYRKNPTPLSPKWIAF